MKPHDRCEILASSNIQIFFEAYCSPTLHETPWHHRIRRSNSQKVIPPFVSTYYSTHDRHPPDDAHSSANTPTTVRSVARPLYTANIKPTTSRSDNNLSTGMALVPLNRPMVSYCPPWPPPNRPCWYPIDVAKSLPWPQYQQYTTQHKATPYYV